MTEHPPPYITTPTPTLGHVTTTLTEYTEDDFKRDVLRGLTQILSAFAKRYGREFVSGLYARFLEKRGGVDREGNQE